MGDARQGTEALAGVKNGDRGDRICVTTRLVEEIVSSGGLICGVGSHCHSVQAALSARPHPNTLPRHGSQDPAMSPQHHVQDPATTNPPQHDVQDPTANLPPRHLNTVRNAPPPPTPTPPPIHRHAAPTWHSRLHHTLTHRHAAPTRRVGLCHRLPATLPHPDTDSRPHHRPPTTPPQPSAQDPAIANQSPHHLNTDANPSPPTRHATATRRARPRHRHPDRRKTPPPTCHADLPRPPTRRATI
ncbi:hypothetical protein EDB83DRAFT_2327124 [Lactarius deliciosus]|nr:hypothetical protein EDB83DRAFT_2327124 [Lactarius deliciosus]